jgi:hypothetical protein
MPRELLTAAEFAQRIERDPSWVAQLRKAGRLVLVGDLVDCEASIERIAATAAGREGVVQRHADERAAKAGRSADESCADELTRARREKALVEAKRAQLALVREELELDKACALLVPIDAVNTALGDLGAAVRAEVEMLPDRWAPMLTPLTDHDEVVKLLERECRDLLTRVSRELGKPKELGRQDA